MGYVHQPKGLTHCREINKEALRLWRLSNFNRPWKECLFFSLKKHCELLKEEHNLRGRLNHFNDGVKIKDVRNLGALNLNGVKNLKLY